MRALLDERLGLQAYIALLQGYHALYTMWETQHSAWLSGDLIVSGWSYRSRIPSIESDLIELGVPLDPKKDHGTESKRVANTRSTPMPHIALTPWGALYVIEGSALGGQIIARHLSAEFPCHPHGFFNLCHGKGLPTWRNFQCAIEDHLLDASSRRAITLQARNMFGLFQKMLEGIAA